MPPAPPITPDLEGVPETMLWTLYNRASEARRPDGVIEDPYVLGIIDGIDYDFAGRFGPPDGTHALRSRLFDEAVRPWMAAHPGGAVIELGCGLETQFHRCDDGRVDWCCVDLPEAIAVRERFLTADARCRHIGRSALDPAWMQAVAPETPVFITAQGLLMYFAEAEVQRLITAALERWRDVTLMFDVIPRWFSRKTLAGYARTPHYTAPPMPWGIDRHEITPTLRGWSRLVAAVEHRPYGYARGPLALLLPLFERLPGLRRMPPRIVTVRRRADR